MMCLRPLVISLNESMFQNSILSIHHRIIIIIYLHLIDSVNLWTKKNQHASSTRGCITTQKMQIWGPVTLRHDGFPMAKSSFLLEQAAVNWLMHHASLCDATRAECPPNQSCNVVAIWFYSFEHVQKFHDLAYIAVLKPLQDSLKIVAKLSQERLMLRFDRSVAAPMSTTVPKVLWESRSFGQCVHECSKRSGWISYVCFVRFCT